MPHSPIEANMCGRGLDKYLKMGPNKYLKIGPNKYLKMGPNKYWNILKIQPSRNEYPIYWNDSNLHEQVLEYICGQNQIYLNAHQEKCYTNIFFRPKHSACQLWNPTLCQPTTPRKNQQKGSPPYGIRIVIGLLLCLWQKERNKIKFLYPPSYINAAFIKQQYSILKRNVFQRIIWI